MTGLGIVALAMGVGEPQEHGLSQSAVEIARPLGFPVTNSMLVSWIVAALLIVFARLATRRMDQVPDGAQNFVEWLVESLYQFLEGILGRHLVDRTFWFFGTIFIFILAANWIGLIPGIGSMGWGHDTAHGFVLEQPLLRGANADVNLTLAMALVFFASWIVWGLRELGPLGFLKELFAPKGESTGVLRVLLVVVFFAVGCLEVVSILFRPVSLSFRLYGNVFAGESMLETMARMPQIGWLTDPLLFSGTARGVGSGACVHAVDCGLHAPAVSARRARGRRSSLERSEMMTGSLHVALAAFGAAIAVGIIGMKASEAVGRNPGSSTKVLVQSIGHRVRRSDSLYTRSLVR